MKIVEMLATLIAMADPPLLSAYGLHAPYALRTLVELIGEDGLTGAAETPGGEQALSQIERARGAVVGRDADDLARLRGGVERTLAGRTAPATVVRPGAQDLPQQTPTLLGEGETDAAVRAEQLPIPGR